MSREIGKNTQICSVCCKMSCKCTWEMKINNTLSAILLSEAQEKENTLLWHKQCLINLLKREIKEAVGEMNYGSTIPFEETKTEVLNKRGIKDNE